MYLTDFNYHSPRSLQEAFTILKLSDNAALIAGGTDILVEMKRGIRNHKDIVSLADIKELKLINEDGDNIYIGAGVTHNEVVSSTLIKNTIFSITETALKIGTEQIRNVGTIGGNLCTGASCCDMAPILLALNSSVEIISSSDKRIVSLKDFFINHRETSINKTEIMTKIIVPVPEVNTGAYFEKFGLRESASISVASVAVSININNNKCEDVFVVIGAAAPVPKICSSVKKILVGKNVTEFVEQSNLLKEASDSIIKESFPIDDIRGSIEYRKNILRILSQRTIIKAVERAKQNLKKS